MKLGIGVGIVVAVTASLVAQHGPPATLAPAPETAKEVHLSNVKQLTFGGENAEAYFSFDGQELIFQSTRDGGECDQIYAMRVDGTGVRRVSSGEGRTTCSYLHPRQAARHLRLHVPRRQGVPATAGFQPRLCMAGLQQLRHLQGQGGWHGHHAADLDARLRRRGDDWPRRPDRLHQRARRRHGDLLDERRWRRREAADQPRSGPTAGRSSRLTARGSSSGAAPSRRVQSSTTTGRCFATGSGGRPRSRSS